MSNPIAAEPTPTETNEIETNEMTATAETSANIPDPTEAAAEPAPASQPMIHPRIRAGAIAWGLIVCAISVTVLVTVSSSKGRTGFLNWVIALGPGGQALILVLGLGVFILLLAGLSLIRRAQRRHAARAPATPTP